MTELNELMRDCLIYVNNAYPNVGYVELVVEAVKKYVSLTGAPIVLEDEEDEIEFFNKAIRFLIDCVLFNLIEQGLVEMAGIEDGEMVFQATVEF